MKEKLLNKITWTVEYYSFYLGIWRDGVNLNEPYHPSYRVWEVLNETLTRFLTRMNEHVVAADKRKKNTEEVMDYFHTPESSLHDLYIQVYAVQTMVADKKVEWYANPYERKETLRYIHDTLTQMLTSLDKKTKEMRENFDRQEEKKQEEKERLKKEKRERKILSRRPYDPDVETKKVKK